jgi:hypothetical protein
MCKRDRERATRKAFEGVQARLAKYPMYHGRTIADVHLKMPTDERGVMRNDGTT